MLNQQPLPRAFSIAASSASSLAPAQPSGCSRPAHHLARFWGVGVGVGQAQEFRALAISAAEAVLAVTLLELAWVQSNPTWLEANADYLSILNAVPAAAAKRIGGSVRAYVR